MKTYTVKIHDTGTKEWYLNGKLHREDGPAVEYADGTKIWYLDHKRHRTDGPAIEYADGTKIWYLNGERLTESQWREAVQPKPTCAGKIVEIDGKRYKLVAA
jgi:hypothetical protein